MRGLQPLVTAPLDMCLTMARAEIEARTTCIPAMVRLVCRNVTGDWARAPRGMRALYSRVLGMSRWLTLASITEPPRKLCGVRAKWDLCPTFHKAYTAICSICSHSRVHQRFIGSSQVPVVTGRVGPVAEVKDCFTSATG
jgi:hypothetical protein